MDIRLPVSIIHEPSAARSLPMIRLRDPAPAIRSRIDRRASYGFPHHAASERSAAPFLGWSDGACAACRRRLARRRACTSRKNKEVGKACRRHGGRVPGRSNCRRP